MIEDFEYQSLGKLPSKGMFYPEGHPFHNKTNIPMKVMRVGDEALLMNPYLTRTKQIDQVLLRRITGLPELNVFDLLAGDVAGLYFSLFISNYEYQMERRFPCAKCGTQCDCIIMVDTFPVRTCDEYPAEPFKNLFYLQLPISQNIVGVKFPTHGDILELQLEESNQGTAYLKKVIVSINEKEADDRIKSIFINQLNIRDAIYIRKFITENEPGVISTYKFFCQNINCKHQNIMSFGYGAEMFGLNPENREEALLEPAWLLSYLSGESFENTWSWPVAYRRWWIKRIEKDMKDRAERKDDIPDKHPLHNQPDIRQLLGMSKDNTPNARVQRFT